MHPTVDAEQGSRHAQAVAALADAVATLDRGPPIHVAVDGLTDPATRALADDLGRVLTGRGPRCRRVTLDALSLLIRRGQGLSGPPTAPGPATTWS